MKSSRRRISAVFHKELREYRHNGNIISAMAIFPVVFIIQPLIQVFTLSSRASVPLRHEHSLLYILAVPVLVPATLASYSIVGERLKGHWNPCCRHQSAGRNCSQARRSQPSSRRWSSRM